VGVGTEGKVEVVVSCVETEPDDGEAEVAEVENVGNTMFEVVDCEVSTVEEEEIAGA
jgi:hypothetical protein